jgi:hypothetical protein
VQRAGVGEAVEVLERHADDEVVVAVAVDVAGGERGAEAVSGLGDVLDAGDVLVQTDRGPAFTSSPSRDP